MSSDDTTMLTGVEETKTSTDVDVKAVAKLPWNRWTLTMGCLLSSVVHDMDGAGTGSSASSDVSMMLSMFSSFTGFNHEWDDDDPKHATAGVSHKTNRQEAAQQWFQAMYPHFSACEGISTDRAKSGETSDKEISLLRSISSNPFIERLKIEDRYKVMDEDTKSYLWQFVINLNKTAGETAKQLTPEAFRNAMDSVGVDSAKTSTATEPIEDDPTNNVFFKNLPENWKKRLMAAGKSVDGNVQSPSAFSHMVDTAFTGATGDDVKQLMGSMQSMFSSPDAWTNLAQMAQQQTAANPALAAGLGNMMAGIGQMASSMASGGGFGSAPMAGAGGPTASSGLSSDEISSMHSLMTPTDDAKKSD